MNEGQGAIRELLLLGVLLQEKMHGYRLNEYVAHAMGMYADLKKPTAYYALQKLEKGGYVRRDVEREGKRPERHVYEITDEGRDRFHDLLRQHLGGFTRTYFADDIGIAFMDRLPKPEARRLLAEKREKVQAVLKQFLEVPDHGGSWSHVIKHNVAHLITEAAWLDEVLSELADDGG